MYKIYLITDFHKNDIKVYIDKLSKNEWNTFSSLYEQVNEIRKISLDETNWKLSRCTCCYYMKNYICSHIIILAVTIKKFSFPNQAMQVEIGQSRKRGRPGKTDKALKKQNNENVSTSSSRSSKSDTGSSSTDSSVLVERANKRNPRVAIANNDTLDDVENLEDNLEETPINAPIDTIAETIAAIASTSKTASASSPDGMISFRGPSSQKGKGTLMPTATFEACKLLMKQKKNIQETDKQPRRSARNKKND